MSIADSIIVTIVDPRTDTQQDFAKLGQERASRVRISTLLWKKSDM